jgi:glycosyltransferase involved in cell wall biosynthesis
MSIKKGNDLVRLGKVKEALEEYKKVPKTSPLHQQVLLNIQRLEGGNQTNQKAISKGFEPLVSVVMPVFNVAPYLDACILSVLNQSYQNIELIIVNDASTDNGLSIINMFADLDKRIQVINLEFNTLGGAGIPSNIGVDNAKGEFIAYADSDDILDKNAVSKMVEIALSTHAEVVVADFCNFSDDTRKVDVAYDKANWKALPLNKAFSPSQYPNIFKLSPVPWRKLYKRAFLDENKIRFPEGDYFYEDNPLHWFALSQAKNIVLLDYVVAFHRMGREAQTMGANNFKLSAHFSHLNTIKYFLQNQGSASLSTWKALLIRSGGFDWAIKRQETQKLINLFKKRNSQVFQKILDVSNISYNEALKIDKKFDKFIEYNKAQKDIDLTIIIPIYNCEDLLEDTLLSLTKFNSISVDVFLIDDGSTDNSKSICEKYASKYDNFHLLAQNNRGAGVARNAVIPLVTGEYTYFLDADDTVDVVALEESVRCAQDNQNDLLLFKYKIHLFEKNTYKDMFGSDSKIWISLLKAKTNAEKQVLASSLINYPWIRIIKTNLLHDENIFFGKTVVHNDVPYHWHSIISAKNIGVFDKAIYNHRKFEDRVQITNINDVRRMMVFEAYRHTNCILKKYEPFDNIFENWKKFITNLLVWANNRIPEELKPEYKEKENKIRKELGSQKKNIGFYRIMGNSIGELHAENQAYDNLEHIIEFESNFDNVDKYFVLNRITNENNKRQLMDYLEHKGYKYLTIDFDINEYKKIGYDLLTLPDSSYWFQKKRDWARLITTTAVRRLKNAYLMNNNGARNYALQHGKQRHKWTMPWDGNCFLSDSQYESLYNQFQKSDKYKYVSTCMERSLSNKEVRNHSIASNAVEEPQISFRNDSIECFNEERVYGSQPKVELFKRLGYQGVWDKIGNLYPWKKLEYNLSKEVDLLTVRSSVFRLFSGNAKAAIDGKTRAHTRASGIVDAIDMMEFSYIEKNMLSNIVKQKLELVIKDHLSESMFDQYCNNSDVNKIKTSQKLYYVIINFSRNTLDKKSINTIVTHQFNEGVDLKNPHKFKATCNNMIIELLKNLEVNKLAEVIKIKLDLVMLFYFYFDYKNNLSFYDDSYVKFLLKIVVVLFEDVFEYDLYKDLKKAKITL